MQRGAGAWVQTVFPSRTKLPVQLAYEVFQDFGSQMQQQAAYVTRWAQ